MNGARAAPPIIGAGRWKPHCAVWAELNVVVAAEFRDGNLPARKDPLRRLSDGLPARGGIRNLPNTLP